MVCIFLRDEAGHRPFTNRNETMQHDPHWREYLLFHEFFPGENGTGLGASHQTGWTGLVATLLQQLGEAGTGDRMDISRAVYWQTPLGYELPECG